MEEYFYNLDQEEKENRKTEWQNEFRRQKWSPVILNQHCTCEVQHTVKKTIVQTFLLVSDFI